VWQWLLDPAYFILFSIFCGGNKVHQLSSRFRLASGKSDLGNFAHGSYANFLHACFYLTTELKGYNDGPCYIFCKYISLCSIVNYIIAGTCTEAFAIDSDVN
jgi:hypothetical protein